MIGKRARRSRQLITGRSKTEFLKAHNDRRLRPHISIESENSAVLGPRCVFFSLRFLPLIILFLIIPAQLFGQAWSGVIDPSRAIDWHNNAGVKFTIPSASWTQCATSACNILVSVGSSAT